MHLLRSGCVVLALVAALSASGWSGSSDAGTHAADQKKAAAEDEPDLEVKELRFGELEARLSTMEPGPERDYFAGLLANATRRIAESIRLLNRVLPSGHRDRTAPQSRCRL